MRKFAHIINPVNAPEGSELARVQPITFAALHKAKDYAQGKVQVELLTTQFPEDRDIIPEGFTILPDLQLNVESIAAIDSPRKLPLLREILEMAAQHTDAEYLIYTNVDIGVDLPFYKQVNAFIDKGYDGLIIHRRRVSGTYNSPDDLEAIYADAGKFHSGFDTFVFKCEIVDQLILGDVCLGIPHVGNTMAHNLMAWCENLKVVADAHLTFHVGMDLIKNWGSKPYVKHNTKHWKASLKALKPHLKIHNIPAANLGFFKRHFMWLMNPNFKYPLFLGIDLKNLGKERQPKPSKERHPKGYWEWLMRRLKTKD